MCCHPGYVVCVEFKSQFPVASGGAMARSVLYTAKWADDAGQKEEGPQRGGPPEDVTPENE